MYRGQGTGAQYRFGNNASARMRYVHPADAPMFLAMPNKFRRAEVPLAVSHVSAPQLVAPGNGGPSVSVAPAPTAAPAPSPAPVSYADEVAATLMTDAQALTAVKGVAERQTYAEIKAALPSWSREEIERRLAEENASAAPQRGVVKLLETALYGAPVSAVPVGNA